MASDQKKQLKRVIIERRKKRKGALTKEELLQIQRLAGKDIDIQTSDEDTNRAISEIIEKKKQKANVESSKKADRFGGYWTRDKDGKLKFVKIKGKESEEQRKARMGVFPRGKRPEK